MVEERRLAHDARGQQGAVPRHRRRTAAAGRVLVAAAFAAVAAVMANLPSRAERRRALLAETEDHEGSSEAIVEDYLPTPLSTGQSASRAFLSLDEKDGRFCGKEGDMCKCFGRVRYGRLFHWSGDLTVDGSVNCSAALFGDPMPMELKICKCYPMICTTDVGICTPEPCSCPTSHDPAYEWGKKTLMTGDGTKCWACEKKRASAGIAVQGNSSFCPTQLGRCSLKRSCKCEQPADTKRVMRTKNGEKCWTCAPVGEGNAMGMDSGQKAMFWMLPLLWPWMDVPNSLKEVCNGCRALTTFVALCLVGYLLQVFAPFLRLDRFLSFYAPCMKKGEIWRFFTYFMLHSDLQHLCTNLFHLLDALDLEGVPDLEVSPGVPLRCTRDGPIASICYPDVGIGLNHVVGVIALVLAFGALLGTIKNFGALVQGASSVCFGVDGALIGLYALFLGAGLDSQLKIPEFGAFFWMRIGIIAFHIIIDMVQSICGAGKDTVGTMAHMASLVAGFCYVIIVLPPMGDGSLFTSDTPYIVNCGMTSPKYVTIEDATTQCLAFFRRGNGIEVATAQRIASVILGGGVLISIANAIHKRDITDDGIAVFSCGEEQRKPSEQKASNDATSELDRDIASLEQHVKGMQESVTLLDRLYANMPDLAPTQQGQPAAPAAASGAS
eukprot:TRINITY_DN31972_c0_g1_i1.p1 TRINITY_DN31972_c0_g1~~TRINITY_DN31972_c0_g1_i1.p1  ORF type:complete len:695 (+),score=124.23 TRINITY_DN31972_c0_g1_i1:88-2085(+)